MKKNLWLKMASVIFAVAMWLFVISRGQTEISLQVPISYQNVPEMMKVVGKDTRSVVLDFKGHERFINDLRPGDISVEVDLASLKQGRNEFRIEPDNITLPVHLTVINVIPSTVVVEAEEMITKNVPVEAFVRGTPGDGYAVRNIVVVPAEIILKGTAKELRYVREIKTEPMDISAATDTVVKETRIVSPQGGISTDVDKVTVQAVIVKEKK